MMLEPHSPVALAVDEAHRETKRICHTAADDGNKVVEANVNAVIQAGIATANHHRDPAGHAHLTDACDRVLAHVLARHRKDDHLANRTVGVMQLLGVLDEAIPKKPCRRWRGVRERHGSYYSRGGKLRRRQGQGADGSFNSDGGRGNDSDDVPPYEDPIESAKPVLNGPSVHPSNPPPSEPLAAN